MKNIFVYTVIFFIALTVPLVLLSTAVLILNTLFLNDVTVSTEVVALTFFAVGFLSNAWINKVLK